MSKDTLKHYVKNYIQSHAGNVVEFAWQGGEPTLLGLDFYKQAVEYQQEFAQGKQITNAFQTNGIALNQQWAAFFKQHHFLIGLSIDGLSAVHNRYRISGNGNPTFEKVVKAFPAGLCYDLHHRHVTGVHHRLRQRLRAVPGSLPAAYRARASDDADVAAAVESIVQAHCALFECHRECDYLEG